MFKKMIILSHKVIETFHWALCIQILPGEGWWKFSSFDWPPGYSMDIKYFIYLSCIGEKNAKVMNKWAIIASLESIPQKFGHASLKQIIDLIHIFTLSREVWLKSTYWAILAYQSARIAVMSHRIFIIDCKSHVPRFFIITARQGYDSESNH